MPVSSETLFLPTEHCETCSNGAQVIFALGQIGYDVGPPARRDSIAQHMEDPGNPYDGAQLVKYLRTAPWDAASVIWTLDLEGTPLYAVDANGPFARDVFARLCDFLSDQSEGVIDRVSMPGVLAGQTNLSNGQTVPVIWPEMRGMYSWNTDALTKAVCGPVPSGKGSETAKVEYDKKQQAVRSFITRVYQEFRNAGMEPADRALNYAATNAFQTAEILADALDREMELDKIDVQRSQFSRPGSDCWDVRLSFFHPRKLSEVARRISQITVDVSDVVPVLVGDPKSWHAR